MFQEEVHQHRDLTLKMKKKIFNSCTQENTAYTKKLHNTWNTKKVFDK